MKTYAPRLTFEDGFTSIKTLPDVLVLLQQEYDRITRPEETLFYSRTLLPFEQGWFMKNRVLTFSKLKELFKLNHGGEISWRFMKQFVIDECALDDLPKTHKPDDISIMPFNVVKSVQMFYADGAGNMGNKNIYILQFKFINHDVFDTYVFNIFTLKDERENFKSGIYSFDDVEKENIIFEIPITFPQLMELEVNESVQLNYGITNPAYWKIRK